MATLADCRRRAGAFNAEIVVNSTGRGNLDIEAIPPTGYTWKCGLHSLVITEWDDDRTRRELYRDLLDRMNGLRKCDCELCT